MVAAVRSVLLDLGPLVAVLNRTDRWREQQVEAWQALAEGYLTTAAPR